MTAVEIKFGYHGAEKLARLADAIKDAGDKDMRRELFRAMQRSTKPLKKAAREGAIQILPHRGGLAEVIAASKFTSRVRTHGKGAGVRIVGSSSSKGFTSGAFTHDLSRMDAGRLRHPVYGNRRNWVTQGIRPGWFTDSLTVEADNVRGELVDAIDRIAAELEAKA